MTRTAHAGPFDDIAQSISKAAADVAGKTTTDTLSPIGQATSDAVSRSLHAPGTTTSGSQPASSTGKVSNRVAAQAAAGPVQCVTRQSRDNFHELLTNTCPYTVIVLSYNPHQNRCFPTQLRESGQATVVQAKIAATCRKVVLPGNRPVYKGACQCLPEEEISSASK